MRSSKPHTVTAAAALAAALLCSWQASAVAAEPMMSDERAVFQTQWGDIHFGFYPEVSKHCSTTDMMVQGKRQQVVILDSPATCSRKQAAHSCCAPARRHRTLSAAHCFSTHIVYAVQVAPITAQHIFKLVAMGAYTGNHFFRVDKGFVAQVQDVTGGRNLAMDAQQRVSNSSPGQTAPCSSC
eukprot:GHRQ01023734.1.p1 GENE.GHRQ01023734.1~~GHRQ01023734.1.p1  ORF type:complete len:183 (-),score=25.29 GHRQ01023734.1:230-778(-)